MKRLALALAAVTILGAAAPISSSVANDDFPHGVAARAESTRAILWARGITEGTYRWQVSTDRRFRRAVKSGVVDAEGSTDLTMKTTVRGLKPATRYHYRFVAPDGARSARGTFRTAPAPSKAAGFEIAFSGDSDVLWTEAPDPGAGEFSVLHRIREEKPDLFVYMGDTIYSDSETGAAPALTREEKWDKYKANRVPAPAQKLLRSVSTWAMWDDHETINDYDGAELASSDPGLFQAGIEAFGDYWPVPDYWPLGTNPTYRVVSYGKNVDMFFLDERTFRTQSADEETSPCRDAEGDLDLAPLLPQQYRAGLGLPPVEPECFDHVWDPDRTMLGAEQKSWLLERLERSDARWKLIMNQVPITQLFVLPYDRWEGYAAERQELLRFIGDANIRGVVFLTTDIHANLGSPAFVDILDPEADPVAWEVVTGPIQTCTLDCEVDRILGTTTGGELMKSFLVNNDLVAKNPRTEEPYCAEINTFSYATVAADRRARSLHVEWRSHERGTGGGRRVPDCPAFNLNRP
jgi:alkaline phosphatase D